MRSTDPQLKVRLPHALKEQIERAAGANNRSLNGEIVSRLRQSFEKADGGGKLHWAKGLRVTARDDSSAKRFAKLEERMAQLDERMGRLEGGK